MAVGAKGGIGILNYLVDIGLDGVGLFEFTSNENDQPRCRGLGQGADRKVVRSCQPATDGTALINQAQIERPTSRCIERDTNVRAKRIILPRDTVPGTGAVDFQLHVGMGVFGRGGLNDIGGTGGGREGYPIHIACRMARVELRRAIGDDGLGLGTGVIGFVSVAVADGGDGDGMRNYRGPFGIGGSNRNRLAARCAPTEGGVIIEGIYGA